MWLESIQFPACDSPECPTCGGPVQRRAYGEMHAGSYVHDGKRVEIRRVPDEGFRNPVVLDPITVYFDGGLYRLWPSEKYWSRGGKKLHREVWRVAFGPIPRDCHIHHRDGNPSNNMLDNLECLPATEHLSLTWAERCSDRPQHFTPEARAAAADWHKSDAGRLWHKRHAERAKGWTKWAREDRPCDHCGAVFKALARKSGHSQRFCGVNCKAAHHRKRRALAAAI